jgi:hypothetical protein
MFQFVEGLIGTPNSIERLTFGLAVLILLCVIGMILYLRKTK